MPKAERGTPKDIANRMKAKGLQKLKFYCQMCSKQCRDENGFKCHLTSDSHLRQMKIFSDNASGIMDRFSREFEDSYLETLRRRHGTKRMNANNVYQEVIQDKHHVHMNSTKWATLTDFVQYLGKSGKCVVDETERGWYVSYVERDPALLARQEAHRRRVEAEKVEEAKAAKRMEKQRAEAAVALDRAGGTVHVEPSRMAKRAEGEGTVVISIAGGASKKRKGGGRAPLSVFGDDDDDNDNDEEKGDDVGARGAADNPMSTNENCVENKVSGRKRSRWGTTEQTVGGNLAMHNDPCQTKQVDVPKFDRNNNDDDKRNSKHDRSERSRDDRDDIKARDVRKENWLHKDIIVRIISKKLAKGAYYKRKGVVERVIDKFTAEVEVLDSAPDERDGGDIIRLDQDDLETVMPKEGKKVRILNGRGRGEVAKVLELDKKKCRGVLEIVRSGEILDRVDYEDFSKIA